MFAYLIYRLVALLSRCMPRGIAYWAGLRVADAFYFLNARDRRAVMDNLRHIFAGRGVRPAEDTLRGFARKTFQYFGKYLVDFFRFAHLSPEDARRMVSVERIDHLETCARSGRGVLLVTAHFGNWEMGGAALNALGYRFHAVVQPERNRLQNRLFQRYRAQRGAHVIPLGHSARDILRALRRGEPVALLGDRELTARDDRIRFFDAEARLPIGPVRLAQAADAFLLPVFLLRQVDDSFLLRFHPPIDPRDHNDTRALWRALLTPFEREIGEHPYQWFSFEPFWPEPARSAPHDP